VKSADNFPRIFRRISAMPRGARTARDKHDPSQRRSSKMKSKKTTQSKAAANADSRLEIRYGKIGISAVAAAMHFQTSTTKTVQSPSIQPEPEHSPEFIA
jgi:hypothetical protein